ncbi:DUF1330 domain-containing protein [Thalassotalea euphylliae]|uniref:DUF1330 domain-containing protein n=1 Tax=Thalassotalea euphylliae TaxID=1655234 RepID=UPI00362960E8
MVLAKVWVAFLLCCVSVAVSLGAHAENGNKTNKSVYLVAQIGVKDYQEYMGKYGKPVTQLLVDAGAEILVASREGEVLEGVWSGNWTVISRFPNDQALKTWYNSNEYRVFKKMRIEQLIDGGNIVVLPSLK